MAAHAVRALHAAQCRRVGVLVIAAILLWWAGCTVATAQPAPLKVGVLPNVSARVIFNQYQSVRAYLEAELKRPVEIQTAADFKTFHARTRAAEYDVVVTAANLARLAQLDHQWVPLAMYDPPIPGVLVRIKGGASAGLNALKGKQLALSNPQSLVAMRGFAWLAEAGLRKDIDYTPLQARNDDSLGTLMAAGNTPYAIMSMGEFRAIPQATRDDLEIETEFARVPGFVVMHAPAMPAALAGQVRAAVLRLGDSAQGAQFFELSGFRAVRALRNGELEALDAYVAATRAGLAP